MPSGSVGAAASFASVYSNADPHCHPNALVVPPCPHKQIRFTRRFGLRKCSEPSPNIPSCFYPMIQMKLWSDVNNGVSPVSEKVPRVRPPTACALSARANKSRSVAFPSRAAGPAAGEVRAAYLIVVPLGLAAIVVDGWDGPTRRMEREDLRPIPKATAIRRASMATAFDGSLRCSLNDTWLHRSAAFRFSG